MWFCAEEEDQARLGQGGYASAQSLRHPGQPFVQAEAFLCTLHELLETPCLLRLRLASFRGERAKLSSKLCNRKETRCCVSNNWAGFACADPDDLPLLFVSSPCCQPRPGKVWGSFSTALTVEFEAFDTSSSLSLLEAKERARACPARHCRQKAQALRSDICHLPSAKRGQSHSKETPYRVEKFNSNE